MIQQPMSNPTQSRIRLGFIEIEIPEIIAVSICCQPSPLRQPTPAATAAPTSKAIWFGP